MVDRRSSFFDTQVQIKNGRVETDLHTERDTINFTFRCRSTIVANYRHLGLFDVLVFALLLLKHGNSESFSYTLNTTVAMECNGGSET